MAIKSLENFNQDIEVAKEVLASMPINNAKNLSLYKNKIAELKTIDVACDFTESCDLYVLIYRDFDGKTYFTKIYLRRARYIRRLFLFLF